MLQKVLTFILNALKRQEKQTTGVPPPRTPLSDTLGTGPLSTDPKSSATTLAIAPRAQAPVVSQAPVAATKVEPVPANMPTTVQTGFATADGAMESKLSLLYPPFASTVRSFILEARRNGMDVSVFQGLRTFEEQQKLYQKGRDANFRVVDRKSVVTNAPPGMSMHNYGLAVDVVFDGNPAKPGFQWSWSDKYPWKKLALLGKEMGLEPAYFWKTFPEAPHFEKSYGTTYRELHALYKEGGTALVWSVLSSKKKTTI